MLNLRPHADPLRQNLCFNISLGYLCIQGSLESTAQEGGMRKWELKCQGSGAIDTHHFTTSPAWTSLYTREREKQEETPEALCYC